MEKIICGEIDEAKGKTLLHVVWSVDRSNLLLVFDGDFPVQLGVDRGCESGDEQIKVDPSLDQRFYREELLRVPSLKNRIRSAE